MDGSGLTAIRIGSLARDAVAVLAHTFLRFDRPDDAAALLAALAELEPNSTWARCALCLALLRAERTEEALASAEALLEDMPSGIDRVPVLHIAAKAAWRLGRSEQARAYFDAARGAASVSVPRGRGDRT